MNKNIKNMVAVAAISLCASASAQNLNSAYFLEGYTYGHELNPAKDYDRKGYISFPIFGHFNLGMTGNLSLTDVLKFDGNQLTTYLNPNIPIGEAMSGFSDNNYSNVDLKMNILGFGFHAWGGYNTFNVSMRTNLGFNVPYGLFDVTKELANKDYDISDITMDATAWAEIGLGHSRNVSEAWRVGGKLKVLLAGGRAKLNVKKAQLDLTAPDRWLLHADAQAEFSVKGLDWGEMERKEYSDGTPYEQINLDNLDVENPGPNGWGLGFDLGAEWDLGKQGWVEGMKISASLLDLGFLSWNETHLAYNKGKEVVFTGFNDIQVEGGSGTSIDDQADSYSDRFSSLVALQDGGVSKSTSTLGTTINVGVEYVMPFYSKLRAGFLSTTRIQGQYSWNEERISATISPVKWLEGSINVGFGTRGSSVGWVLNIHPRGYNLFVGMDHTVTKVSKQGIPLGSNTGIALGINIPIGGSSM